HNFVDRMDWFRHSTPGFTSCIRIGGRKRKEKIMQERVPRRACALIVWVGLVVFPISFSNAADLIGIGIGGTLWDINKTTGLASNPRATGVPSPIDIAATATGSLYSANATISPGGSLFKVNPVTGATIVVGPTGLPSLIEGGLTFNATGTLYGAW